MISEKPVHFLATVKSMQTSETNATEDICTHVYLAACEMKHNMRKNWLVSEKWCLVAPLHAGYGKT